MGKFDYDSGEDIGQDQERSSFRDNLRRARDQVESMTITTETSSSELANAVIAMNRFSSAVRTII